MQYSEILKAAAIALVILNINGLILFEVIVKNKPLSDYLGTMATVALAFMNIDGLFNGKTLKIGLGKEEGGKPSISVLPNIPAPITEAKVDTTPKTTFNDIPVYQRESGDY